jgi:hypothetical protein
MASKDLASLPTRLSNPDEMSGKDFKAKSPAVGSGEEGMDQLYKQSPNQMCPGDVTGMNFKTQQNSNEAGTSLSYKVSVDFGDGEHASPDQK